MGRGFAFFRWRAITLQTAGAAAMGHDWRCSWCRDEWYAVQRNQNVFRHVLTEGASNES